MNHCHTRLPTYPSQQGSERCITACACTFRRLLCCCKAVTQCRRCYLTAKEVYVTWHVKTKHHSVSSVPVHLPSVTPEQRCSDTPLHMHYSVPCTLGMLPSDDSQDRVIHDTPVGEFRHPGTLIGCATVRGPEREVPQSEAPDRFNHRVDPPDVAKDSSCTRHLQYCSK